MDGALENMRQKLIFRSWHRGTREMDLILGSFAEKHVPDFDEEELGQYKELLMNNDPDLYDWYTGKAELPVECQNGVFQKFLNHEVAKSRS